MIFMTRGIILSFPGKEESNYKLSLSFLGELHQQLKRCNFCYITLMGLCFNILLNVHGTLGNKSIDIKDIFYAKL
jgi:hypothetical protein